MSKAEPAITPELVAQHGLKPDEYERFLGLLGRAPTFTELGICSAMWNEHCSYKSSKKWLKTLPTTGKRVICGPGENAGVIDIDDGQAIIFKMESHNHPSFIEPYQGSATGVGGILRDVFTMGARPIAALNALRFGEPSHPRTKHLVSGVVAGVGGYGNSFGVPTLGGEVNFHARYNGNNLVNAMAVGLADADKIFYSKAKGVGLPVVYLGAKTGRDGIHGATMASAEFDEKAAEKRPTVQVGDPFTEKCLLEACLELMASGAVIAIQDMGAAGLTCSAVEMGAKGDLGIELDLDKVPCREPGMTAYEMMLSESQERMLMVLKPEKEKEAEAIFVKWGLAFAVIGTTTDTLRFIIKHGGEVKADLPIKEMGDNAPEYDRPWVEPKKRARLAPESVPAPNDLGAALVKLMGSPDMCSRRWVWEQYDTLVQSNSAQIPGGDAGVVRINDKKGIAVTSDVTPRYVEADPFEGGKQAVAESWRNLTCVGAEPIAITDNLNFGNPERPEIMGQLVFALKGIGEACKAFDYPIVSGNVSLYNETMGQGILPTPTIGGVGLLPDLSKMMTSRFKQAGDVIILIGGHGQELGQSAYLRDVLGREEGAPPPVDLAREKKHGDFVRAAIHAGNVTAVHDLSDGGLAAAVIEMALPTSFGVKLEALDHVALFAEDQARYMISAKPDKAMTLLSAAQEQGVPAEIIGEVTAEATLKIGSAVALSISEIRRAHEGWFPEFMASA
ncbi:phosphoribosylformylglycinamidine synthase subunit PurL [Aestuariivirga litoralis]|uniref:phosphoribosylformylglycinamidine synthase subunit PurL n=1 Tax=Aestuariivirga litoralis TaxID=2650924 RepID=UPI0018C6B615|nr:phosphoribosylformylglycinamidine synthase subunit PurL [Aestuariivirga litoralis]MBG1231247.1 phosphoribosylformylglycinamidine synthase subunit PurL [Aestuariivirga litoralis]